MPNLTMLLVLSVIQALTWIEYPGSAGSTVDVVDLTFADGFEASAGLNVSTNGGIVQCAIGSGNAGPCATAYVFGTTLTLTGTPDGNHVVGTWGGDCSGTTAIDCSLTMSVDRSISANFGNGPIALNISTNGSGSGTYQCRIDASGSFQTCAATYPYTTSVEIRATPSATAPTRSHITAWSGDCAGIGTGTSCAVTMLTPLTTAITFDLDFVTVSLTIVGTGTVSDSGGTFTCSTGTCMHSYPWGVAVTFPKPGGNFVAWAGACTGGNTCSLSATAMQNNQSLTATFTP